MCFFGRCVEEIDKDCHSDEDPIFHLFEDNGVCSIGGSVIQFDASVDGPWVHDEAIFFGGLDCFCVDLVEVGVFIDAGYESAFHSFFLEAKGYNDIGVMDAGSQIIVEACG